MRFEVLMKSNCEDYSVVEVVPHSFIDDDYQTIRCHIPSNSNSRWKTLICSLAVTPSANHTSKSVLRNK